MDHRTVWCHRRVEPLISTGFEKCPIHGNDHIMIWSAGSRSFTGMIDASRALKNGSVNSKGQVFEEYLFEYMIISEVWIYRWLSWARTESATNKKDLASHKGFLKWIQDFNEFVDCTDW